MSTDLTAILIRPLLVVQLWFLYRASVIILHRFCFLRRCLAQQLGNMERKKEKDSE